jgi:CheY-like chemotaxis protein
VSDEATPFQVLIVDDRPDEARALAGALAELGRANLYEPDELTADALAGNDVVLVDYDLTDWEVAVRAAEPACSPADGLALAAVLRSRLTPDYHGGRPVAFALHSSQLHRIGGDLDQEVREHAIARVHNLEWVFDKQAAEDAVPLADRVAGFASAVRSLPEAWPDDPAEAQKAVQRLLGWSPDLPAAELAWDHVMRCHPPLHELSLATGGLTCLRWLAHRILPYPCFLLDRLHLAVRLGVDPKELAADADKSKDLFAALADHAYRGALPQLVGSRWWRASVEAWLWDLGAGSPLEGEALHVELERIAGRRLGRLEVDNPVVALDERYRPLPEPAPVAAAVRIQPDDWPPFADDAWTTLELVGEHPRLRDQVVADDRDLIADARPS